MRAMGSLSKLASDANSYLLLAITDYEKERAALLGALEDQGITTRALAAVAPAHDAVGRGHELEARAMAALANHEIRRQER